VSGSRLVVARRRHVNKGCYGPRPGQPNLFDRPQCRLVDAVIGGNVQTAFLHEIDEVAQLERTAYCLATIGRNFQQAGHPVVTFRIVRSGCADDRRILCRVGKKYLDLVDQKRLARRRWNGVRVNPKDQIGRNRGLRRHQVGNELNVFGGCLSGADGHAHANRTQRRAETIDSQNSLRQPRAASDSRAYRIIRVPG
jgi:hypothetical protein